MILVPNVEPLREYNTCHAPAGTPQGGQFCSSDGSGTRSQAFREWFGASKVVDEGGDPLRVYHGTLSTFDEFDPTRSNPEGDSGAGLYFTDSVEDANENYSHIKGPDIETRITARAERLESDHDFDKGLQRRVRAWLEAHPTHEDIQDAFEALAKEDLGITHGGATLPVYLRIERPFLVEPGNGGTFLDFNQSYDGETDEYGEPHGKLVEFMSAIRGIASEYRDGSVDGALTRLYEEGYDGGGISAGKALELLRDDESFAYYTDDEGRMVRGEIIRRALERVGFDGIIDRTVHRKFSNMRGVRRDTAHYIVFSPEQVKSAIGNRGTYNRRSRRFTEGRRR